MGKRGGDYLPHRVLLYAYLLPERKPSQPLGQTWNWGIANDFLDSVQGLLRMKQVATLGVPVAIPDFSAVI